MRFAFIVTFLLSFCPLALGETEMNIKDWNDVVAHHPAADALNRLFPNPAPSIPSNFKSTGLTRKDYLTLIAGNVDYWKHFQDEHGAIIDPYEHKERQYSTPAFALASAELLAQAKREDLLPYSLKAMTFATAALANHTTADNHADFYIPMLMHAHRILIKHASADLVAKWDNDLRSIIPEKNYRAVKGTGNWNIVHLCGELLRRKDGLVAPDKADAQMAHIEQCLEDQQKDYTKFGMYHDPNSPLAYDAFPRLWFEDMMADGGAYEGPHAQHLREFLTLGGVSSLLMLSPSGEWPCGGRSAHHQWNEAENAVICEINARYWKDRGRDDIASSFKRAAHLALTSMKRWQRPSGEMWIVKNFADPARRFAFEGYSFNSQYNLLPMAMLAIAYERADDSISESPIPTERGGYCLDLRDTFHKVIAAAGGYYIEFDTAADPHYNATGLQRVHRAGVALSPLSDSSAPHRGIGPSEVKEKAGLTPGLSWASDSADSVEAWSSLADFVSPVDGVDKKSPPPMQTIASANLTITEQTPARVAFRIEYELKGPNARQILEEYRVTSSGVEGSSSFAASSSPARAVLPVMTSDGAHSTVIDLNQNKIRIQRLGGVLNWEITSPSDLKLQLIEPKLVTHNGYVQRAVAPLPSGTSGFQWKLTLEADH